MARFAQHVPGFEYKYSVERSNVVSVEGRVWAEDASDVSAKVMREAMQAFDRLDRPSRRFPASTAYFPGLMDPESGTDDLRRYAIANGVDFDAIVQGASEHFASATITRRTYPLTAEELEMLFDDDQSVAAESMSRVDR